MGQGPRGLVRGVSFLRAPSRHIPRLASTHQKEHHHSSTCIAAALPPLCASICRDDDVSERRGSCSGRRCCLCSVAVVRRRRLAVVPMSASVSVVSLGCCRYQIVCSRDLPLSTAAGARHL